MEDRLQSVPLDGDTHDPDATAPLPSAGALDSGATILVDGTLLDDLGEDDEPLDFEQLFGVQAGDVLAGRYTIVEPLGRGGFGTVWRARVGESDEHVAVKVVRLHNDNERRLVRREVAALRWARLPGVVRLLDDGTHDRDYFIVMEQAAGAPFPGARAPLPWPELKPRALQLLEILARVHLSGLIHRDLKPQNILVDEDGRCTLLDLGIVAGRALHHSDPAFAFTPHYAAPEQRVRGGATDERTDLYAFGVLLLFSLTGSLPHTLAHPLDDHPDVPADVAEVIARLLEPNPADRYASALEVIDALGGQLPPFLGGGALDFLPRDRPATADELRPLFHGPELFFHYPEDAANELWRRTGGHIEHIEAELGAWLRSGIVHWDQTAIRITREAIERLQSGLRLRVDPPSNLPEDLADIFDVITLCAPHATPTLISACTGIDTPSLRPKLDQLRALRLCWSLPNDTLGCPLTPLHRNWERKHLRELKRTALRFLPDGSHLTVKFTIDTTVDTHELISYLLERSRQKMREGEQEEALFLLNQLDTLAAETTLNVDDQLLTLWSLWALYSYNVSNIEGALVRLERLSATSPLLKAIELLLRSRMFCLQKEFDRALKIINSIPAFQDIDLEEWRGTTLARAMAGTRNQDWSDLLDSLYQWSQVSDHRQAIYLGWKGTHAYISSRFKDAAYYHESAAELKTNHQSRLSSLTNSAGAYLEALDFDHSIQIARSVISATRKRRDPYQESRAHWIIRTSQYRKDHTKLTPAPRLLEAAQNLMSARSLFSLTEAALLWRQGRVERALHHLNEVRTVFRQPGLSQLLDAFDMYLTRQHTPEREATLLEVVSSGVPDMIAQTMGVVCYFNPSYLSLNILHQSVESRPQSDWGIPLDFFSFNECILLSQGVRV